ncbi:SRPBCC family protein [Jeotgalibacillus sp. ET6]|uniref:SRPBCC family protein n=1 Tax=Jeotgalibacillus sp. ET6 TaxID=3037260 RepID=UPI00241848BD|nr:SRPBCC family protein [Jeotgalibacillus sp. ET6]MDG5472756.1 SRPBCC family protein [Jeotgalibacillus sp. ET6]
MGALNQTIVIDRPIEEVFAVTTTMEQSPQIMDQVEEVTKLTEGAIAEGTKYNEVRNLGGRRVQSVLEVVEYVPNVSYAVSSSQNGVEIEFRYTFKPQGDGTFVTFDGKVKTSGFARSLFRGMIVRMISKEELFHLQKLKTFIEKEAV